MGRVAKLDFTPVTGVKHGVEEYFRFFWHRWSVTEAFGLITPDREVHAIDVVDWYGFYLSHVDSGKIDLSKCGIYDKEFALSDEVDTKIPLLVIKWYFDFEPEKEQTIFIDGHNRLYKAFHTGQKFIAAYLFSFEEAKQFYYSRGC